MRLVLVWSRNFIVNRLNWIPETGMYATAE